MKNPIKFLSIATAGLLLLAAPASADDATAWTQLGFTIQLSSGTLNVTPVSTFNDTSAYWNTAGSTASTAFDGYAFSSVGSSTAISTSLNAGNFFLIDSFALLSGVGTVGGGAASTALSFYDLSFSNVVGPTVQVTLVPDFYASTVSDAAGSFGYVSAFLSLGSESFFSYLDSSSNAGWADFDPITLTVNVGETLALSAALSAGVSAPDMSSAVPEPSTIVFASSALALFALIAVRRQVARRRVAV